VRGARESIRALRACAANDQRTSLPLNDTSADRLRISVPGRNPYPTSERYVNEIVLWKTSMSSLLLRLPMLDPVARAAAFRWTQVMAWSPKRNWPGRSARS
jgi:hypothetical protein